MKSLGQKSSPWDRPLRNLIGTDVSRPWFVVVTTLVFQLLLNFSTVFDNQTANLCRIIISYQPWSTESYAFLTSIHAMLRLRFRRWQSKVSPVNQEIVYSSTTSCACAPLGSIRPSGLRAFPDVHSQVLTGTTWTTCTKYLNRWSASGYRWWILRVSGVVWFCLRRTRLDTLCWYL